MSLTKVGIVLGIVISNASAAENAGWFGQHLFDAVAEGSEVAGLRSAGAGSFSTAKANSGGAVRFASISIGDWQIGGTPIIGDPNNVAPWPLMQAIYAGPNGDAWKKSRIQIYGWEDFSFNLSTSSNTSRGPNANFPLIYDLRPNRVEQNQFVLYLERVPDENQTDHIDWGFRISGVYGLDYRFMISRGFFSDQLLKQNNYYGFDMPMVYFDLYLPADFQGMNIRIGRIISEPDIEAQLAPNNLDGETFARLRFR